MNKIKQWIKAILVRLLRPVIKQVLDEQPARTCESCGPCADLQQIIRYAVQRPVDLVRKGQFYYYCYTNEKYLYDSIPESDRYKSAREIAPVENVLLEKADFPVSMVITCLQHLGEQGFKADFFDVGASLGTVSVPVAAFMKHSRMEEARVFSFEPGAINLLKANIKVNGLENQVTAIHKAVCDMDSYLPFYVYSCHAEGARVLTNPVNPTEPLIANLVPSCRLDTFLADLKYKNNSNHLVIKIDVEGHDADVILGLSNTLSTGRVAMVVFEYSIGTMRARNVDYMRPLTLLHQNNFALYNLWDVETGWDIEIGKAQKRAPVMQELPLENEERIHRFFAQVSANNAYEQTDLLAINRAVPNFDSLVEKLRKTFHPST